MTEFNIFGVRVYIGSHFCYDKMMTGKGCSLYHFWAHALYLTLFDRVRIVIGTPRGDTEEEKLRKLR